MAKLVAAFKVTVEKKLYVVIEYTNKKTAGLVKFEDSNPGDGSALDVIEGTAETPKTYYLVLRSSNDGTQVVYTISINEDAPEGIEIGKLDPKLLCFGPCDLYVIECNGNDPYCTNTSPVVLKCKED